MPSLRIAYTMQNVGFDIASSAGQAILLKSLIAGLRDSGHLVDLVALHGRSVRVQSDLNTPGAGAPVSLPVTGRRPFRLLESVIRRGQQALSVPYLALFDSLRFYEACRQTLPAYDVCHEYAGNMSLGTAWACRRLNLPYVLTVDADLLLEAAVVDKQANRWQERYARWAARLTYRLADRIVTVSEQTKTRLASVWQVDPNKVHVIPNGVDIERFRPDTNAGPVRQRLGLADAPVVMFVGGFYPWHGVDVLVDSFARVAQSLPEARLLLVGDGPVRGRIEAQVARLGLAQQVVFTGMIDHATVPDMLAAADVVTLPYPELPEELWFSPLKLYEYMAAGKAILASDAGQISQVIDHNATGILLKPGSVEALSQGICRLLQDETLRRQLGQNARRQAVARHAWHSQIEKLTAVYQLALSAPAGAA